MMIHRAIPVPNTFDELKLRCSTSSRFRWSEVTYPAGRVIYGAHKQGWLYVLAGSCVLYHPEVSWRIRAGECLEYPTSSEYRIEVDVAQPCRAVWVWDLSLLDILRTLPESRLTSLHFDLRAVEQRFSELQRPVSELALAFWHDNGGLRLETTQRRAGESYQVLVDPLQLLRIHPIGHIEEFESALDCRLDPVALSIGGEALMVLAEGHGVVLLDGYVAFAVATESREGLLRLGQPHWPVFPQIVELDD